MLCASVKKKGAVEQCTAKAIFGHTLCGRHARCKNVRLWADIHTKQIPSLVRLQAVVRGWLARTRLARGGPGALRRGNCANDEDIVTCEDKERVHPFDYFGFEQNGKVWWFEFPTLWKWAIRSHEPANPYTKMPIDHDTLKRLHATWSYHYRHRLPVPDEPIVYGERVASRWNVICQVFATYGFGSIDPRSFVRMSKMQYYTAFRMIHDDIRTVIPDTNPMKLIYLRYCIRMRQIVYAVQTDHYILQSTYVFMMLLLRSRDPYIMAFTMLSALYRC